MSVRIHYHQDGTMHVCDLSFALPDDSPPLLAREAFQREVAAEAGTVLACLAEALRKHAQPKTP